MKNVAEKLVVSGALAVVMGCWMQFGPGWAFIAMGVLGIVGGFLIAYMERGD